MSGKWKHVLKTPPPSLYVDKKTVWRDRLKYLYNIFALGAFTCVIYNCLNGKADWADYYGLKSEEEASLSSGQYWKRSLQSGNALIYRISGFNIKKIEDADDEVKENKNVES
ncbi:uncharacterized protein LOC143910374 [Arctopsyche grandis]|uniref:uncharacterized protein LOC143910374 n=1 Tax=Arctopsyche grandis TaxID=121162 RepID=UPI00406D9CF4